MATIKPSPNLQRIVDDLSGRVAQRQTGSVLPSLRKLSTEYNVSHETMRRALKVLEEKGLVTKRHGLGTWVGGNLMDGQAETGAGLYVPHTAGQTDRTLTFATCELTEDKRPIWEEVVGTYARGQRDLQVQLSPNRAAETMFAHPMPDVLHLAQYAIQSMAQRGLLLNLSPWMTQKGGLDQAMAKDLADECRGADCYGVPVSFDVSLAFLRTQTIPRKQREHLLAHFDLEHLVEWAVSSDAARKLARPLALPLPHMLVSFVGIDPFDLAWYQDERRSQAQLTEAIACFRQWSARYPFYVPQTPIHSVAQDTLQNFMAGKHLVIFHHSFVLPDLIQRARFPWQVWSQPMRPGQRIRRTTLSCAIPKECGDVDAALQFIRYLCGEQGQGILARWKNNIPARRSSAESPTFCKAPPPGLDQVVASLTHTADRYAHGVAFARACTQIWDQQIIHCLLEGQDEAQTVEGILTRCRQFIRAFGLNAQQP